LVFCLGSLEHFLEQKQALEEMLRVARPEAIFIILVPNADFLTRKLGLFKGTDQVNVKEDVKTLEEWQELFDSAGLQVTERWKDLHVLSYDWICMHGWKKAPLRLLQAMCLVIWPLRWQYQIYFMCKRKAG
ncbi:MAG: SAM-dependent methyltransferase, partial [Gammaproteobacteria bacterium]